MKRVISAACVLVLMIMSVCSFGAVSALSSNELQFAENGTNTVTVISCSAEAAGTVTIPESVDGKTVVSISENAFQNAINVTAVDVPDCITNIGANGVGYILSNGGGSALVKKDGFTLIGSADSVAERYAENNGFRFETRLTVPELVCASRTVKGVRVKWKAVKNADSYNVYYKVKGGSWTLSDCVPASINSFEVVGLESGKDYVFTVRALYKGQKSGCDSKGLGIYYIAAPILTCTNQINGVKLSWNKVDGAEKYYIYYLNGEKWVNLSKVMGENLFYTDKTVTSGQKRTYTVVAYGNNTGSSYYKETSICYLAQPEMKSGSCTEIGIRVTWRAVNGAQKYNIYRKSGSSGWSVIDVAEKNVTAFTDYDVTSNSTYSYTVRAVNGSSKSDYETGFKVRFLKAPKLKGLSMVDGGMKVTWKEISGADSYRVYRKTAGSGWKSLATVKGSTNTCYTDKSVVSGTSYIYTVRSVWNGKLGNCDKDGIGTTYLAPPTVTSATSNGKTITVKWQKSAGATSYNLYRKVSGGSYEILAVISKGSTVSYTDGTAKKGVTYIYCLRAFNSDNKLSCTSKTVKARILDPKAKMVALTYDDGPYSPATDRILDALEKVNGKATFFVVGNRVNEYASSVKRAAKMGCEIGNHTYSHKILTSASSDTIRTELKKTSDVVKKLTGVAPTIMRPPGGAFNSTVKANCEYPMIIWSVDTLDWKTRDASSTIATVKRQVKDGSIILMHDLYGATATASETIIPWLVSQGYELVTVSELMQAKGITMENGQPYYNGYSK